MNQMDIYTRNQQIFADTRRLSCTVYGDNTKVMQQGVQVYPDPLVLKATKKRNPPKIIFSRGGTLGSANKYRVDGRRTAVLNFADALVPGGLVLQGEVTQEESICRCTNLYEGLILPTCISDYYNVNRALGTAVYSDRLIYSPDVLVFKHDSTYTNVKEPFYVDVITCPAPSCPVPQEVLYNRIRGILRVAGVYKVEQIVLGAWGCGAFGQDATIVGSCFAQALKVENYFKTVIFAILEVVPQTDHGNFHFFQMGFSQAH